MPPNNLRDTTASARQRQRYATGADNGLKGDFVNALQLASRKQQQRRTQLATQRSPGPTIKITPNGKPMVRTK